MGRTPGAGPLLVYVHGLGCAGNLDWPPVMRGTALQGHASLWVDLVGFGQSERPADFSYDLRDQAELLAARLGAERGRSCWWGTAWAAPWPCCSPSAS